jgi:hypothetical protein
MNQTPSKLEWALGLHDYPCAPPSPQVFARFFGIVSDFFGSLGVAPTHVAAEGDGYTGKLTKFGGIVTKRLVESEFVQVSALSIVVSPKDSKEPAFDRLISASLTWTAPHELLLCFVSNEAAVPFKGAQFDRLLHTLLEWKGWAFGFGLKDEVSRQPDFHVLTIDNGMLASQEREALTRWYRAKLEDRKVRLRDVYPVNILGREQTVRLVTGKALGDVIRGIPASTVEEVNGVTVWKVSETALPAIRAQLGAQGSLIAVG